MSRSMHIVIPDVQAKPGVPLNHMRWIGDYIAEKKPNVVMNLGDHADVPSLSFYDRGKKDFEGRRYSADLDAAELANSLLLTPAWNLDEDERPELHILMGNHEHRITRYTEDHPEFAGHMGVDDLNYEAWYDHVHPFLAPIVIDGIMYSHYFYNPATGRPLGGMIETRIKSLGQSFTMGHQQGMKFGLCPRVGRTDYGLIAGSCYLHYEKYIGPQANDHWRGFVVKRNVDDGEYGAQFIPLDYMCERYEGMTLREFMNTPDRWEGV